MGGGGGGGRGGGGGGGGGGYAGIIISVWSVHVSGFAQQISYELLNCL